MAWYQERSCELCGASFLPERDTARFCSASCRARAWRGGQEVSRAQILAPRPAQQAAGAASER